ncbi:hypothetical protein [Calothrix sp. CCY 0018]|uniref:hypothetical protein n=1 Tax=Calothrix sp. CCY 0018 TaxID=3103864 RepID=UPI0039C6D7A4
MTDEVTRADNDSPWKEILEAYFPQAMQFIVACTFDLVASNFWIIKTVGKN